MFRTHYIKQNRYEKVEHYFLNVITLTIQNSRLNNNNNNYCYKINTKQNKHPSIKILN